MQECTVCVIKIKDYIDYSFTNVITLYSYTHIMIEYIGAGKHFFIPGNREKVKKKWQNVTALQGSVFQPCSTE